MSNKSVVAPEGLLVGLNNDHNTLRKIEFTSQDPRTNGRAGNPGDLVVYTTGSATYLMVKDVGTDPFLWVVAGSAVANAPVSVAKLFSISPDAADTDVVHAIYDSVTLAFPGPFTNPDVPRNLSVTKAASWDGGTVTVTGTNQFDEVISETFNNAVETTVGAKIFKTVTAAVHSVALAGGAGASVGVVTTGGKFGLPERAVGTVGALWAGGTKEAVVIDPIYSSFDPTTAPDGAVVFEVLVNVLVPPLAVSSIAATGADGDNSIAAAATNQYTATATYNDAAARALTAADVTWTSSNNAVATVDATGLATGVAAGTCTISAYYKGITGVSATLTVT